MFTVRFCRSTGVLAPIQWSVLNGDKVTGITTMLMAEGMDTGDILMQCTTPIGENETASELFDRLAVMGADLLIQTLEKLEKGELTPVKQNDNEATYASMLTKDMCMLDFSKPAREVHKKICGLSDWPCATTMLNGKRLKVYRSEIVSSKCSDVSCWNSHRHAKVLCQLCRRCCKIYRDTG